MRVLYLFLVYKNPEMVERIISRLKSDNSIFYIHVDANSKYDFSGLTKNPNVSFAKKRYATSWGSPELAYAVLETLREALTQHWDYVCLLSESDYPVKSPQYIAQYLENSGKDHILINQLPCRNPLETPGGYWSEDGMRRVNAYALRLSSHSIATIEPRKFNVGNLRQFVKVLRFNPKRITDAVDIFLNAPKRVSNLQPCGGHQWFFLRRTTVESILYYVDLHPEYINYSKDTLCLDEIFFPTIVNEVIEEKDDISRDILRYISWNKKGGSSPCDLTTEDRELLCSCKDNPDILLVRKISDTNVADLLDSL